MVNLKFPLIITILQRNFYPEALISTNVIIVFTLVVILSFGIQLTISKRGIKYLNYLLGLFVFARFGQLLIHFLIEQKHFVLIPFLTTVFSPLYYVAPAIVYLYTVGFLNNRTSLKKIDYLHFLPGILILVDNVLWHFSNHTDLNSTALPLVKISNNFVLVEKGFFPSEVFLYIRPILMAIYLYLSFLAYIKSKSLIKGQGAKIKRVWILSFLILISAFQILNAISVYFRISGLLFNEEYKLYLWMTSLTILLFVFMLIYLIANPRILYGYILVNLGEKNKIVELKQSKQTELSRPIITDPDLELVQSFQQYMTSNKPFLSATFQIIDLAHFFKMPTHHCSALINKFLGKSFKDWVNCYRVEHFIATYPEKSKNLTIYAMACESGFSGTTTFYRAFKKETGKMPLDYFSA